MANIAYEFLVRWDHVTGALKGAYIKTYDNVTRQEGEPQAVATAGATGFPLADILASIEAGAILAMEAAQTALVVEKAAREAAQSALVVVQTDLIAEKAAHEVTKAKLLAVPPVVTPA